MNENMINNPPAKPAQKRAKGKPWKTIKGKCRSVPVYRWESNGRTFFRVPISGGTPPEKTTSNEKKALDLAKVQADIPAHVAPTLGNLPTALLVSTAQAIQKLEPILKPLEISVTAGLEEYAHLKARTGKLGLSELFDGLLAADSTGVAEVPLAVRVREIAAAIAKLNPILGPLNISVASGIEEYAAVKKQAGTDDLRELFKQLLSKEWVEKSKTPIAKAVEEFLYSRKHESGVSDEYYRGLHYTVGHIVEKVGPGTPIGDVTTEQLKPLVFSPKRELRSNKAYRTNVRNFFTWCKLNQYLDYGQPTAADRLAKIKVPPPAPIILTIREAKAILSTIEDPWCLLYLALSMFTGIRHDELQRLTFDLIKPVDAIVEITAEISKTSERRLIPIQPVLDAWPSPFYGRSGLVLPIAYVQAKVLKFILRMKPTVPDLPGEWGRNWFRHSYASYRLAQTGKVLQTAKENGHYAYILESVYLALSTEADALAYFALTPEACGKSDWPNQVETFLASKSDSPVRAKNKSKGWKPIGGYPELKQAA